MIATLPALVRATPERPALIDANFYGEAGLLELPRAQSLGRGRYTFGAYVSYDRADGRNRLHPAPVNLGFGLPYRLDLALAFNNREERMPVEPGTAPRLAATLKYEILGEALRWYQPALALALRLDDVFSPPRITPLLIADWRFRATTLVALGGYEFVLDEDHGHAARLGLGLEQRLRDWLVALVEATARHRRFTAPEFSGSAGMRLRLWRQVGAVLAVTVGQGAPSDLRVVFGLRHQPTAGGMEDSDQDGIVDKDDLCPEEREDRDGFQDTDGCPDNDNDGDGIPDAVDPTPDGPPKGRFSRGPVRMRLHIPEQPIPKSIMRDSGRPGSTPAPDAAGSPR